MSRCLFFVNHWRVYRTETEPATGCLVTSRYRDSAKSSLFVTGHDTVHVGRAKVAHRFVELVPAMYGPKQGRGPGEKRNLCLCVTCSKHISPNVDYHPLDRTSKGEYHRSASLVYMPVRTVRPSQFLCRPARVCPITCKCAYWA